MSKQYKVTLDPAFKYSHRTRAGIVVQKARGYTGQLTDAQLEAIELDHELAVQEVKAVAEPAVAPQVKVQPSKKSK